MEHSAGIIPYMEGKYCLIREMNSGEWGFPKGHLEEGETELEAAKRELFEETGLQAEIVEGYEESFTYFLPTKGKRKRATYFLGIVTGRGEATHAHEISDQGWFPFEEAMERLTHHESKDILSKAKEHLESMR